MSRWLAERRHLSPSTIRNGLIGLRAFYRYTLACGLREDNPTKGLHWPKVSLPSVEPYSDSDLLALLGAARGPRDRAIIRLLWGGGLRCSELLRVQAEDINWQDGTIRIRGKGNKYRLVSPGPTAMRALRQCVRWQPGDEWRGGIEKAAGLKTWMRRLGKRAGIEHANLHRFRHTFASGFIDAGGEEGQLQKILGHSTLAMSLHYAEAVREKVALRQQRRVDLAGRL